MRAALTPVFTMANQLRGPLLLSGGQDPPAAPGIQSTPSFSLIAPLTCPLDRWMNTQWSILHSAQARWLPAAMYTHLRAGITPTPALKDTPQLLQGVPLLSEHDVNTELTCLLTCTLAASAPRTHLSLSPPHAEPHTLTESICHHGHPGTHVSQCTQHTDSCPHPQMHTLPKSPCLQSPHSSWLLHCW